MVRKGDRYYWDVPMTDRVEIEVLRVSRFRRWADILIRTPGFSWIQRQSLPFPGHITKRDTK